MNRKEQIAAYDYYFERLYSAESEEEMNEVIADIEESFEEGELNEEDYYYLTNFVLGESND